MSRPPVNKWLATLAVSFGTLMATVDSAIVNVALSQIRSALGATVQEITWTSTSFIIATVLVLPLTGFFSRLLGQKRSHTRCGVWTSTSRKSSSIETASSSCSRRVDTRVIRKATAAAAKNTLNRFHSSPCQTGERVPMASMSNPHATGATPRVTLLATE